VHDNYFVLVRTWSLAVKAHFYILLPLLLSVLIWSRKRQPFTVIPLLFAISGVVCLGLRVGMRPEPGSSYETQFRLDSLFAGVALSYLYHFHRNWFPGLTGHKSLLLALLFCYLGISRLEFEGDANMRIFEPLHGFCVAECLVS
jgi:peptidoglycan/LPS O-acetylase OafA/YrhL